MTSQAQKFDCIINRYSGTVLNAGEDAVLKGLQETLGDRLGSVIFIEGKDITSTVRNWVAEHADRGLLIGGGDGTVLTAATEMMGRHDITLGVLPLGTHNLFARQLGFAADFRKAAAQYNDAESISIDVGRVNDMHFLIGLMLDKNTVHFFEAREDMRVKKRMAALGKILSAALGAISGFQKTLVVGQGDHTAAIKGRFFMISNNRYAPRPSEGLQPNVANFKTIVENIFAKDGLSDGKLALYAFAGGPVNALTAFSKLLDGTWTQHKALVIREAAELRLTAGKGSRQEVTIVLDGELKTTKFPLDVRIIPQSLKVFRPK